MKTNDEALAATRWSLICRLKNLEDQDSWQDFFETYWRLIYGVAVRSGLSHAEAEDVVQETVLSVCKHIPTFQADPERGSFKSWLLQMTRWRIIDQARRKKVQGVDVVGQQDEGTSTSVEERIPDPAGPALDVIWEEGWRKHVVDAALGEVRKQAGARHYQMFVLMLKQGKSPQEVADMLKVPVDQVYVVKHRLTKMMEAAVAEQQRLGE